MHTRLHTHITHISHTHTNTDAHKSHTNTGTHTNHTVTHANIQHTPSGNCATMHNTVLRHLIQYNAIQNAVICKICDRRLE